VCCPINQNHVAELTKAWISCKHFAVLCRRFDHTPFLSLTIMIAKTVVNENKTFSLITTVTTTKITAHNRLHNWYTVNIRPPLTRYSYSSSIRNSKNWQKLQNIAVYWLCSLSTFLKRDVAMGYGVGRRVAANFGYSYNKKLRFREEHSASVVLSWRTLWHFSGKNLFMANQPLLRNWPRKLPNSAK